MSVDTLSVQLNKLENTLRSIRLSPVTSENELHTHVQKALTDKGFQVEHEAIIAPRSRVDFLVGRIAIEIKRSRPNKTALLKQLNRYAQSSLVDAIFVITEKSLSLPSTIMGKPILSLSLLSLWGIAPQAQKSKKIEEKSTTSKINLSENLNPIQADIQLPSPVSSNTTDSIENETLTPPLPDYLSNPQDSGFVYGTLSYNRRRKCWVIKGDPEVTEMAKRLFPGSHSGRRGTAFFSGGRRNVGNLNWLMLRYPLSIAPRDQALWQSELEQARSHYQKNSQFQLKGLLPSTPPQTSFRGELRDFQKQGLYWLNHTQRGLLADEMGLGKTVQLLALLVSKEQYPVLIVVPPHLVLNWQSEINRFLLINGKEPQIHVLKGLTPYELPQADIYLCHYLLLRGWKEALPIYAFRMVVFDEIQELRRSGTEKYSAASLLAESVDTVIGLSGTPIYNRGGEIWNVMNIIDFHFLGDWESFSREWCYGYAGDIVAKPELLGTFLRREGLMLRRTKADVLPELPEKRRLVQKIDVDSKTYRVLMQPVIDNLMKLSNDETLTLSEKALLESNISRGQRQATGVSKAPYVAQFVRALLEEKEKVLLFAHHHLVMDQYKKDLKSYSPAMITGRETAEQKQKAQERFLGGRTNLCIISLRAASGLNLQNASCVVFGELDWSPAVHSQAEDRAHRIGQKDSLLCYYLVSPKGSDAYIQDALGLKISQFSLLMGQSVPDESKVQESANLARTHAEKLLQKFLSRTDNEPV